MALGNQAVLISITHDDSSSMDVSIDDLASTEVETRVLDMVDAEQPSPETTQVHPRASLSMPIELGSPASTTSAATSATTSSARSVDDPDCEPDSDTAWPTFIPGSFTSHRPYVFTREDVEMALAVSLMETRSDVDTTIPIAYNLTARQEKVLACIEQGYHVVSVKDHEGQRLVASYNGCLSGVDYESRIKWVEPDTLEEWNRRDKASTVKGKGRPFEENSAVDEIDNRVCNGAIVAVKAPVAFGWHTKQAVDKRAAIRTYCEENGIEGYLLGRDVSAEEAEDLIDKGRRITWGRRPKRSHNAGFTRANFEILNDNDIDFVNPDHLAKAIERLDAIASAKANKQSKPTFSRRDGPYRVVKHYREGKHQLPKFKSTPSNVNKEDNDSSSVRLNSDAEEEMTDAHDRVNLVDEQIKEASDFLNENHEDDIKRLAAVGQVCKKMRDHIDHVRNAIENTQEDDIKRLAAVGQVCKKMRDHIDHVRNAIENTQEENRELRSQGTTLSDKSAEIRHSSDDAYSEFIKNIVAHDGFAAAIERAQKTKAKVPVPSGPDFPAPGDPDQSLYMLGDAAKAGPSRSRPQPDRRPLPPDLTPSQSNTPNQKTPIVGGKRPRSISSGLKPAAKTHRFGAYTPTFGNEDKDGNLFG